MIYIWIRVDPFIVIDICFFILVNLDDILNITHMNNYLYIFLITILLFFINYISSNLFILIFHLIHFIYSITVIFLFLHFLFQLIFMRSFVEDILFSIPLFYSHDTAYLYFYEAINHVVQHLIIMFPVAPSFFLYR
jgi:hypothetical protein